MRMKREHTRIRASYNSTANRKQARIGFLPSFSNPTFGVI